MEFAARNLRDLSGDFRITPVAVTRLIPPTMLSPRPRRGTLCRKPKATVAVEYVERSPVAFRFRQMPRDDAGDALGRKCNEARNRHDRAMSADRPPAYIVKQQQDAKKATKLAKRQLKRRGGR